MRVGAKNQVPENKGVSLIKIEDGGLAGKNKKFLRSKPESH